ncbi:MAG: hypothetical protein GX572_06320 [Clostridia bacterium]|nr:hypothetical protein [Clostridia bacterium]
MAEKTIKDIGSRKIIGMPVYSCKEGLNLGNIKQLLIDSKTYLVQGFLLERKVLSKYERILPFTAVHQFGEDGVTVETASLLERRGQNSRYVRALHHPLAIIGSRVFTTAGRTLGKIEEFLFSSEDGRITGLEIAPDGFFKERSLVRGEHLIAISGHTAMLKDEAILDAISLDNPLLSNIGNMADNMREKAGEFISNTADFTKRISTNINERIEKIKKREEDFLNDYDDDYGADQQEAANDAYLDCTPVDTEPSATELVRMAAADNEPAGDGIVAAKKSIGADDTDAEPNDTISP